MFTICLSAGVCEIRTADGQRIPFDWDKREDKQQVGDMVRRHLGMRVEL